MPRADLRRARRDRVALSVAESEARHRALLAALPEGVVLHDTDGTPLVANPAACRLLGLDPADLGDPAELADPAATAAALPAQRGTAPTNPAAPARPAALLRLAEVAAHALTAGVDTEAALVIERDGGTVHLRVGAVPLLADDGRPQAVVTRFAPVEEAPAAPDLTTPAAGMPARVEPEPVDEETRRRRDMFRQSMQHSPIGFGVTALNGRFLRVNRKLCRMLGFRADELQERTLHDVVHPDDQAGTAREIDRLLRGEVDAVALERRYVGHGGMQLWGMLAVTLVRDDAGRPIQLVVQINDVSEIHQAQQLLTHMTLHDPLTGLPNRTLVLDRISKALDRSQDSRRRVAVLLCDVDHFRVVNDSAGHESGDDVLIEIGRRISRALRAGDTAGRLGGDEFVVVAEDVADEREAVLVAERVREEVTGPLRVGEATVHPTVSIGIAVSTERDADPNALLRDADIAHYRAKDRGRNRWDLVDQRLRQLALDRLDVEHALRTGLEGGELRLHFQPIVDLTSRRLIGREALIRWEHPERGLLAPVHFLPVAEESGLITDIGRWVLHEAARAAAATPHSDGYVSINVSPHQVAVPGLAMSVDEALTEAGLGPDRLVVELTESVMLSAAPAARQELEQLHDLGVRVVVDDFGTGFSALSYLRDLPISGIKVDRSFTAGVGEDEQCDRIVEALTELGDGLGLDVVVEGVETEAQRKLLSLLGAEHAQGYLFGKPSPEFTPV